MILEEEIYSIQFVTCRGDNPPNFTRSPLWNRFRPSFRLGSFRRSHFSVVAGENV